MSDLGYRSTLHFCSRKFNDLQMKLSFTMLLGESMHPYNFISSSETTAPQFEIQEMLKGNTIVSTRSQKLCFWKKEALRLQL